MNTRNSRFDIIIVGGGASGLFCAIMLKKNNPDISVAILEKQKSVGKKLLATGNGRCNLTNMNITKDAYHGTFKEHIENLVTEVSPDKLLEELKALGLLTTTDSEGRVYPLSKHSSTVLDILLLGCKSSGVQIFTETFANKIDHRNNEFIISNEDSTFTCGKLIISTGSKATPETGADDSILNTLKRLGHTTTQLTPSLCPVPVKSKALYSLKGVRVTGKASIIHSNRILKSEYGEIQFTDKTLSGICLFSLSRIANTTDNTFISIDLLPETNQEDVYNILSANRNRLSANCLSDDLLSGMFQKKLGNALLLAAGINKDRELKSISFKELETLAALIKDWRFEVKKSDDFSRAQVVAGGINSNEINHETMESKKIKNMYLIGEIVDCDGDCGGYNLHFAFATAYRAAKRICL